ncbi:MAG: restriction endonuclease [Sulfuricurvum sp.]|nr:restriction endonuclease [Sulfuricurvum sp.]
MITYEYENINFSIPSEFRRYFSEKWGEVKATQYCGALKMGDQTLTILPKIDKHSDAANLRYLTYMLSYVYDLKVDESVASTDTESSPILELLISIFSRELIREVEKGLYREYISVAENLRVMRGRFLAGMDARTNFVRDKIYCEYDEFSPDNPLNALFAYAVNVCRRITKSDENRRKLGMLHLMFDEVNPYYNSHATFHWHRLNERFRHLYQIALLILEHLSIRFDKAGANEWAFMFDMNVLFEQFMGKIVQSIEPTAIIQAENNFGNLKLKPDILIPNKLVIDTKYKKVNGKDELKRDDKYQMYVYGKNYKIDQTMLLYPKHIDDVNENLYLGKAGEGVALKMRSIELQSEVTNYKAYINEMKNKLKEVL